MSNLTTALRRAVTGEQGVISTDHESPRRNAVTATKIKIINRHKANSVIDEWLAAKVLTR
jgi:hypothetical protein